MSRMGSRRAGRRARRQFTDEFMAGAVRLVLDEERTVGAVARELDLTPSSLANWVRHVQADRTKGKTRLTTAEREEFGEHFERHGDAKMALSRLHRGVL